MSRQSGIYSGRMGSRWAMCRGVQTVVLAHDPSKEDGSCAWLDSCGRGSYDLLCAAAEAGGKCPQFPMRLIIYRHADSNFEHLSD